MTSVKQIDVPWFRPSEYADIRAAVDDAEDMHSTYAEWLKAATDGCNRLIAEGFAVNKVDFDLELFLAWCRWKNAKVDTNARSQFAVERAITLAKKMNNG